MEALFYLAIGYLIVFIIFFHFLNQSKSREFRLRSESLKVRRRNKDVNVRTRKLLNKETK